MSTELKRVKRTAYNEQFTKTYAFNGVYDLFLLSSISKNGRYYLIRVKVIMKFISYILLGFIILINYISTMKTVQDQCTINSNL